MRITMVANRLNVTKGGSDLSLDLLARRLAGRGHSVRVITVNTTAPNKLEESVPYTVDPRPAGENVSRIELARTLSGIFRNSSSDTDVFHVFNPPFITIGGLYRWRGGTTPVVGRLNNYTVFCTNPTLMDGECHKKCTLSDKFRHDPRGLPSRIARSPTYLTRSTVEPALINEVDRLFAISPAVREIYETNGLSSSSIDVVPNFYNPEFTTDDGDTRPTGSPSRKSNERLKILYVGRLVRNKGVDVLVDAIAQLDREEAVLNVVGDGEMRTELEEQVAATGVSDRIRFHGWVDHKNLPEYYRAASVFVHPGRWPEPFGRTIIEAMQFGTVPVVTDVGAPPWIVGEAGIVVPKNDPQALGSALTDLAASPRRRRELTSAVSDRVERFAPGQVLNRIEKVYADLQKNAAPK